MIAATMTIMYQALSAQEKKLRQYGVAALRANINARAQEQEADATTRWHYLSHIWSQLLSVLFIGYESGSALSVLARILSPLQGFFNFLVFIYPKVEMVKQWSSSNNKSNTHEGNFLLTCGYYLTHVFVLKTVFGRMVTQVGGESRLLDFIVSPFQFVMIDASQERLSSSFEYLFYLCTYYKYLIRATCCIVQ